MRYAIIPLTWICLAISAETFSQDALVTLQYSDDVAEEMRYFITPAEDGSFLLAKKFTLAPDLDGYVRLKVKLSRPGYVYTSGLDRPILIYVAPNRHVAVRIAKGVTFSGDLRKENLFVNRFTRVRDSETGQTKFEVNLASLSAPAPFADSLKKELASGLREIDVATAEEHRLSRLFRKSLSMSHLLFTLQRADGIISKKLTDGWVKDLTAWNDLRGSLFVDSLINCGLTTNLEYAEYLMSYVNYLRGRIGDGGRGNDSTEVAECIHIADEHLRGNAKETYLSMYISTSISSPSYWKYLVGVFDKLKKEFPGSAAIPVLETEMRRIAKVRSPQGAIRKE